MTPVGAGGALGRAACCCNGDLARQAFADACRRARVDRGLARRAAVRLQQVRDDIRVSFRRQAAGIVGRHRRARLRDQIARRAVAPAAEELGAGEQSVRQLAQRRAVARRAGLLVGGAARGGLLGREGERRCGGQGERREERTRYAGSSSSCCHLQRVAAQPGGV